MTRRRIVVLGGSFDPVHNGHVALGTSFGNLLDADELRIIPAGMPWQKDNLQASPGARLAMVDAAFSDVSMNVVIDPQEILRDGPTFTIDTLLSLRRELGMAPSISLLIGADQLCKLHTWRRWTELFDHAHLCVSSRPGFATAGETLAPAVQELFSERLGTVGQLREQPSGVSYINSDLAVEVAATDVREMLLSGKKPDGLVPTRVLDYIEQHNLYKRR